MTALVDVCHDVLAHGWDIRLVCKNVELEEGRVVKVLGEPSRVQPSDEPFGLRCIELEGDTILTGFREAASEECRIVARKVAKQILWDENAEVAASCALEHLGVCGGDDDVADGFDSPGVT